MHHVIIRFISSFLVYLGRQMLHAPGYIFALLVNLPILFTQTSILEQDIYQFTINSFSISTTSLAVFILAMTYYNSLNEKYIKINTYNIKTYLHLKNAVIKILKQVNELESKNSDVFKINIKLRILFFFLKRKLKRLLEKCKFEYEIIDDYTKRNIFVNPILILIFISLFCISVMINKFNPLTYSAMVEKNIPIYILLFLWTIFIFSVFKYVLFFSYFMFRTPNKKERASLNKDYKTKISALKKILKNYGY